MKKISAMVAAAVFSTFAFLGVGPSALAASADAQQLLRLASAGGGEEEFVEQLDSMGLRLEADELEQVLAALPASAVTASHGAAILASSEPVGWTLDSGKIFVSFQLDDGGLGISSLTLIMNDELEVKHEIQSLASLNDDSSVDIRQWVDGSLNTLETIETTVSNKSAVVETTVMTVGEGSRSVTTSSTLSSSGSGGGRGGMASTAPQIPTQVRVAEIGGGSMATAKFRGFSLKRFNACLSSAGVAWWVVAAVAATCFFAGVATAGAAFAACVVGTAGVTSGTTGYCVGYATYY